MTGSELEWVPGTPENRASLLRRFWEKVEKGPGCWEWAGRLDGGYGRIASGSPVSGTLVHYRAHRLSWEVANAIPVPSGMQVLHLCDNPSCVNPDHLEIGTVGENMRQKVERGRSLFGEKNPRSVLREGLVAEIRRAVRRGASYTSLAKEYGLTSVSVGNAARGKTWKNVSEPPVVGLGSKPRKRRRIPPLSDKDRNRLMSKTVDGDGGCWRWCGTIASDGYAVFSIGGVPYTASRVMLATNGSDPGGLDVMHTCDNPECVNPDHLRIGTHQENMSDKVKKNRHSNGRAE